MFVASRSPQSQIPRLPQVKPLIWIESVIEKFSHSRVEIMVKVGRRAGSALFGAMLLTATRSSLLFRRKDNSKNSLWRTTWR